MRRPTGNAVSKECGLARRGVSETQRRVRDSCCGRRGGSGYSGEPAGVLRFDCRSGRDGQYRSAIRLLQARGLHERRGAAGMRCAVFAVVSAADRGGGENRHRRVMLGGTHGVITVESGHTRPLRSGNDDRAQWRQGDECRHGQQDKTPGRSAPISQFVEFHQITVAWTVSLPEPKTGSHQVPRSSSSAKVTTP